MQPKRDTKTDATRPSRSTAVSKPELPERRGRGEQAPLLPFIWGSRGNKSTIYEVQENPFLDIDLIKQRSNKLCKQTNYAWKTEPFV